MLGEKADLLKGTLDMLVLQALSHGSQHGYGVARWIEAQTEGALEIEEGSLYPALYRMSRRGWVSSRWGRSENGRRARYYALTDAGRGRLEAEARSWSRLVSAIGRIVPQRAR
jgi:PadR family transcriptional regulator PadR